MPKYDGAEAYLPAAHTLPALSEAVQKCRGCDLYRDATRAVFGAGPDTARMMLVGEVPGDREDREGEPFVGPAGTLLGKALDEAGLDRNAVYLTNAVKHFRFTRAEEGARRIHKKPAPGQIAACRPWLLAELHTVDPDVVVCLGATAAQSLLGPDFRVSTQRGEPVRPRGDDLETPVVATVHPSAVLRARDEDRARARAAFVADLGVAAEAM